MQQTNAHPDPRIGQHYLGELGDAYFGWQRDGADLGAQINLAKFASHVANDDVVVEFGCGSGWLLAMLPGREKVGVESNAAARAHAASINLRVVAASAELPENYADVAVSNHALEHTLAPHAELRDLNRILKPDGKLVLWLPLDDWRVQVKVRPNRDHHLYTWTPLLLANLLEEAGFEVAEVKVITYAWPKFYQTLYPRLPRWAFNTIARGWAVVRRRRQLAAVAYKR